MRHSTSRVRTTSRRRFQPRLEVLEDRWLPSGVLTWTGKEGGEKWTSVGNWINENFNDTVTPSNGDSLLFPGNAAPRTSTNNLPTDFEIAKITIEGAGYTLNAQGSFSRLICPSVETTNSTGTNTINFNFDILANSTVTFSTVNAGATLIMSGILSGSDETSSLDKSGLGTLRLAGASSNTYLGQTNVSGGTLELAKEGVSQVALAIPASLAIGNGVVRNIFVDQIDDDSIVSLNATAQWILNGNDETIGRLTVVDGNVVLGSGTLTLGGLLVMIGGTVDTGATGRLKLGGNVTAVSLATVPASILGDGSLDLNGTDRTFTVLRALQAPPEDLVIRAQITGGAGLIKANTGILRFAGNNSYTGTTTVTAGTLLLDSTGVNTAVPGNLVVGEAGSTDLAFVRSLSHGEHIVNTASVTIESEGELDLNGFAESVSPVTINDGKVTNVGLLRVKGLLSMNGGRVVISPDGTVALDEVTATSSAGQTATITGPVDGSGKLSLGGNSTHVFTVGDGPQETDLLIDVRIIEEPLGGGASLTKTGPGLLQFRQTNTYTGTTAVHQGTLSLFCMVANSSILGPLVIGDGDGDAGSSVVRNENVATISDVGSVWIKKDGLLDLNSNDQTIGPLTIDNGTVTTGTDRARLRVNGLLTMTGGAVDTGDMGTLRLGGDLKATSSATQSSFIGNRSGAGGGELSLGFATRTFDVGDGAMFDDLVIDGVISSGALTKQGLGFMRMRGGSNNEYTGATTVNAGSLILAKTAGITAIAGPLVIGDGSGPLAEEPGADVVQTDADNQIADSKAVTIAATGRLQLFGGSETIGPLTMTGGLVNIFEQRTLTLTSNVTFNAAATRAAIGQFRISGNSGQLSLGGASRTFAVADGAAAEDVVIASPIVGLLGEGLTKNGPGTLTLKGNNSYAGATTINSGVLLVHGAQGGSPVTLGAATLGGGGTVGAITAVAGTVSPGASPGVLTSGSVALNTTSVYRVELNGAAPGAGHDQLKVVGTVNLGNSKLDASVSNFTPIVGTKLTIIDNVGADPINGTFKNLPEGGSLKAGSNPYRISYVGGDGNDVVLTRIVHFLVTGPDAGAAPLVRVFDAASQQPRFAFLAYPQKFKGGVRVAAADVNGDGFPDIITAPGPGAAAIVQVFSGNTAPGQTPALLLPAIKPYGNKFKSGAFVASGDVNRDGVPDIIVGPDKGRAPTVMIFSGKDARTIGSFNAFPGSFKGGVTVAAGDVDGDGDLDIIAGMASGKKALVRVFDAATRTQLPGAIGSFLAYPASFKGGVYVAAGDVSGDAAAEIITGSGPGSTPLVKVFTPTTVAAPRVVPAYPSGQKRGVRVGTADIDGDGKPEILTALGPKGSAEVRIFNHVSTAAIDSFFAELPSFRRGLFVAGSR